MEENLVTVEVWRNAHSIPVGFAAHPFGRMGLLKKLKKEHTSSHFTKKDRVKIRR